MLTLTQVRAPAYSGYKIQILPPRASWLEPAAAAAFARMNADCDQLIAYTDVYRSVVYQIQCIRRASETKKRLFAPPTKSGHNFGFCVDIAVDETLANFKASGRADLVVASRDVGALGRWLRVYGWTGISKEAWHFEFLDDYKSAVAKIDGLYARDLSLDNRGVQRALNQLLANQLPEPLKIDGVLGSKTHAAALMADKVLSLEDNGACGPWFRRVLAGATMAIKEV